MGGEVVKIHNRKFRFVAPSDLKFLNFCYQRTKFLRFILKITSNVKKEIFFYLQKMLNEPEMLNKKITKSRLEFARACQWIDQQIILRCLVVDSPTIEDSIRLQTVVSCSERC